MLLASSGAGAQPASDQAASIIVYPKIIADGTRDTLVQVANESNSLIQAKCFYVNGAPLNPAQPPDPIFNPPLWQVTAFDIALTRQQPTMWLASAGRAVDPSTPTCARFGGVYDCYGAGADPGTIPVLPIGFTGQLTCVEVDAAGSPIAGNHLTGNATLKDLASGDVSRYTAIGIAGNESNDGDETLCLGGAISPFCPNGAEYDGCPETWILDHRPDGAEIAAVGAGSEVSTRLTVLPCSQNFDAVLPATVAVQYLVRNEFEQQFSTSSAESCWSDAFLGDRNLIFTDAVLGTPSAQTRMRPSSSFDAGILVLAEEFRVLTASGTTATAAANAHVEGTRANSDLVVLPSL